MCSRVPGPVLPERAPIDREGALELNDGEPEQDERGSGGTSSPERVLERIQALPSVEGLVTLGSEDAPVCSDGICF